MKVPAIMVVDFEGLYPPEGHWLLIRMLMSGMIWERAYYREATVLSASKEKIQLGPF